MAGGAAGGGKIRRWREWSLSPQLVREHTHSQSGVEHLTGGGVAGGAKVCEAPFSDRQSSSSAVSTRQ